MYKRQVLEPDGNVLDDYLYEYDSLGRLIRSRQVSDGETVLRTEHQYDTDNRMTGQSYQIGSQTFSEAYTYNKMCIRDSSYLYAGSRLLRETITTTAEDGTATTEILDLSLIHI